MNLFTSQIAWHTLLDMDAQQSKTTIPIPQNPKRSDACLIVVASGSDFHHTQVGQKYMLHLEGTSVGNQSNCEILLLLHDDIKRHVVLYYDHEESVWLLKNLIEDAQSRLYVNGLLSRLCLLKNDDNIQLGKQGAVFRFLQGRNVHSNIYDVFQHRIEEEKKRADTDALTQIPNRGLLEREIKEQVMHCQMYNRPLSAIFMDIDLFKHVNTNFGHPGGDKVISDIAHRIQEQIRPLDTFARYGGEEFVILLRGADYGAAMAFGERIRVLIEQSPIKYLQHEINVTISVGVAELAPEWDSVELLAEANRRLLRAKAKGRNQVLGEEPETLKEKPKDLKDLDEEPKISEEK